MEDEDVLYEFYEQTKKLFSRKSLLSQVSKLLIAHRSDKLFRITDYHFLILYDIILQTTALHNDAAFISLSISPLDKNSLLLRSLFFGFIGGQIFINFPENSN
jgi:hypothetical protein